MKVLSILVALASLLSCVIAVVELQWHTFATGESSTYFVIAMIGCSITALLLSVALYTLHRYREGLIPRLMSLKGACAITNELQMVLHGLDDKKINTGPLRSAVAILATSGARRIRDISQSDSELQQAAVKLQHLADPLISPERMRGNAKHVHEVLHRTERALLETVRLEERVYGS